ncbi:40977_t:CDS:2, partial [Gigaspora margarita]
MWTSRTNMPFLCVMAHWIDHNWKFKKNLTRYSYTPSFTYCKEIDKQLHAIFATFDITTKILCATTDGAHLLNLIVIAGLAPIKSSIENVQNLVKAISSSSSITQDFKELEKSVGESEAIRKIPQDNTYTTLDLLILLVDDIVDIISSCIQNLANPEFLKATATQMSDKLQKYMDEIYDKIAFIAAILDLHIKLELIPADMNTEVNRAIFNHVFRSEYFALILNNSSTNLERPLNLSYTEQIAQKKKKYSYQ